jgi:hypothetical protein
MILRRFSVFAITALSLSVSAQLAVSAEVAPDATPSEDLVLAPPAILEIAKPAYGKICDFEYAAGPAERYKSWPLDYKLRDDPADQAIRKATLHELFCFSGAYNISYAYLIETEDDGIVPVFFASPDFKVAYENEDDPVKVLRIDIGGFTANPYLVNPTFDATTNTLKSDSAWRGLGDASSSGTWKFVEGKFVLTHFDIDGSYDGEINPTAVYDSAAETP